MLSQGHPANEIQEAPKPAGLSLYLSDWKPKGIKPDWDKCSMGIEGTKRVLEGWNAGGEMVEAVAWFDVDGGLRVLVADYDNERRIVLRQLSRSRKITFERIPARASLSLGDR